MNCLYHWLVLYLPPASSSIPAAPRCEGPPDTWVCWSQWTHSPATMGVLGSCHRGLAFGQLKKKKKRGGQRRSARINSKLCYCYSSWGGHMDSRIAFRWLSGTFKHRNSKYLRVNTWVQTEQAEFQFLLCRIRHNDPKEGIIISKICQQRHMPSILSLSIIYGDGEKDTN